MSIKEFARYQKEHWVDTPGYIREYDLSTGILTTEEDLELTLNSTAKKQMLSRLHVVGTNKDFEDDSEFMQRAIDRKIRRGQKTASLFIYDEGNSQAKSIMSENYVRIHNIDILEQGQAKYADNFDKNHSFITDDHMYIGYGGFSEFEVKKKNAQVGDIISFGAQMWNSETGMSSLGVGQLMMRMVCTNGMFAKVKNRNGIAHIGSNVQDKFTFSLEDVKGVMDTIKVIEAAMNRPAIVPQITESTDKLTTLLSKYQITKQHHEGIINAHIDEPVGVSKEGINGWGIYNAVTRYNSHAYADNPTTPPLARQELMQLAYPLLKL